MSNVSSRLFPSAPAPQPKLTTDSQTVYASPAGRRAPTAWWVGVAVITAVAAVVRVATMDSQSIWYDEAVAASLAEAQAWDLYTGLVKDNGNPPLYWILLHYWSSLFGPGAIALRSLSVLVSSTAVPLLAALGRRLAGPAPALLAAGLFALSPLQIELATEARTYALAHFLLIANAWFFVRWTQESGWRDLVGYGITMGLGCYSHYYVLLIPLAHLITLAAVPSLRRRLLPWFLAMVGVGLFCLPWLPAFLDQLSRPDNLARGGGSWYFQFLATPVAFSLGRSFAWRGSPLLLLGVAAVGSLLAFILPALWGLWRCRSFRGTSVFVLTWWAIPILVPLLVAVLYRPLYFNRYASVGLPAFLLAVALGIHSAPPSLRRMVVLLAVVLTGISLYRYGMKPLKDDWRSVVPYVLHRHQPSEILLFDSDIETASFLYYARLQEQVPSRLMGIMSLDPERGRIGGVWFENGRKVNKEPEDGTAEVFASPRLCLILDLPAYSDAAYEALLGRKGYALVNRHEAHHITVYHFAKKGQEEPGGFSDGP
jgi:hypothetical protein